MYRVLSFYGIEKLPVTAACKIAASYAGPKQSITRKRKFTGQQGNPAAGMSGRVQHSKSKRSYIHGYAFLKEKIHLFRSALHALTK